MYDLLKEQARERLNVPAYLIPTEPTAQEASASSLFAVLPYHEGLPDDAVLSALPAETYKTASSSKQTSHLEELPGDVALKVFGYL